LLIYLGHLSAIRLLLDALLLFTQTLVKGLMLPVACLIGATVSFVNPVASLFTFVLLGPIRLVLTRIFEGMRPRTTKEEAS